MNWGMMGKGLDGVVVRSSFGGLQPNRSPSVVLDRHITDGTSKTLLIGDKCMNLAFLQEAHADDDSGFVDGFDWDNIR